MSSGGRILVVNADDLGLHERVDAGIFEAHERGIVTSASLMVHGESAANAAERASGSTLGLGLHIDLGHWDRARGAWRAAYERVRLDDGLEVEAEIRGQLARFCELTGSDPTHLDSHQHVHRNEPVRSVAIALSRELRAPLRFESPDIEHCGAFYGQTGVGEPCHEAITAEHLIALIEALPAGTTELACHPGRAVGPEVSSYGAEREIELLALRDGRVPQAIRERGAALRSFADLRTTGDQAGESRGPSCVRDRDHD